MTTDQELQDALDDTWYWGWPKGFKPDFNYRRPTFEMHVGTSGLTWFVPAVTVRPNRADHIYRTAYEDRSRRGTGFAGGTIILPLIDGTDFELLGGWRTNSKQLLEDTGIDCSNMYLTYGAVGLHKISGGYMPGLFGLLHADKAPLIGKFDRIESIAQQFANERQEYVHYNVVSYGGGSAGGKDPE